MLHTLQLLLMEEFRSHSSVSLLLAQTLTDFSVFSHSCKGQGVRTPRNNLKESSGVKLKVRVRKTAVV